MSLIVEIKKRLGEFLLDVSLETQGGVSGLLGASGSGKSMTLMCIAGIVKPDSGTIVLNGRVLFDSERRVNLTPQKRRVGYLFQNYALFPHMTVRQNILCGLRSERSKINKERLLREIMKPMHLIGLENRLPGQLSGGQQQRAALARILISDPEMLVLDEPFSALDSHLREQLQAETGKFLERFGKDTLLVTHNRDEAYRLCGTIALIDSGKLIIHKPAKQLFADPESRYAAALTGCKNIVGAEKSGEYEVFIPAWNLNFTTSEFVRDDICAIGIGARSFNPDEAHNRFPVYITDEIESPFEYSIRFRFAGQRKNSQNLWWGIAKDIKAEQYTTALGVSPDDIMLLYN